MVTNRQRILFFLLFLLFACTSSKELIPYKEGNKWGVKSLYGDVIIKPEYDAVGWSFANDLINVKKGDKWGLINSKGNLVIEIKYDELNTEFSDGLTPAKLNGLYGFIDKKGKTIIPFIYQDRWWFKDGMVRVKKNDKWGVIDIHGNSIIPFEYDEINDWSEGVIGVSKNNKWGFVNKNNQIVIPIEYHEVDEFSEGLAAVALTYNQWGYIDHANNTIIPFDYENIRGGIYAGTNFHKGIAQVTDNGKSGFINKKNEIVIPLKYFRPGEFCHGYSAVEIDNGEKDYQLHKIIKYGYIDSTGNEYLHDYTDFKNYDWKISSAPKEIPDFSDTLKSWPKEQEDENSDSYNPGIYYYSEMVAIDSNGVKTLDTVDKPPVNIKKESKKIYEKWTLEKLLNLGLNALIEEPKTYPDLCQIKEISIAYGLMMGAGNFSEEFIYPNQENWNVFKKETIYKIISSEALRKITWDWVAPYYKKAFQEMHPFHQQTYKDILIYLKNYINTYDINKTKAYLKRDEKKFAYYDSDGKYNPFRKICAFVDRLILVHKVLSVEDAKTWINKIADEILSW